MTTICCSCRSLGEGRVDILIVSEMLPLTINNELGALRLLLLTEIPFKYSYKQLNHTSMT
jgi:hypothetical protein